MGGHTQIPLILKRYTASYPPTPHPAYERCRVPTLKTRRDTVWVSIPSSGPSDRISPLGGESTPHVWAPHLDEARVGVVIPLHGQLRSEGSDLPKFPRRGESHQLDLHESSLRWLDRKLRHVSSWEENGKYLSDFVSSGSASTDT